jgi:hypothetical protein
MKDTSGNMRVCVSGHKIVGENSRFCPECGKETELAHSPQISAIEPGNWYSVPNLIVLTSSILGGILIIIGGANSTWASLLYSDSTSNYYPTNYPGSGPWRVLLIVIGILLIVVSLYLILLKSPDVWRLILIVAAILAIIFAVTNRASAVKAASADNTYNTGCTGQVEASCSSVQEVHAPPGIAIAGGVVTFLGVGIPLLVRRVKQTYPHLGRVNERSQ